MASRGALGGPSEAALQVALIDGRRAQRRRPDETIGVGQAEIDIVDHADTIVFGVMPGSNDSVPALKGGMIEIPDVIVVNKADHPMTDTMVREVRGVLALSQDPAGWKVPILRTEAARGEGVEELLRKIDAHRKIHRSGGDAGRAPRPQPAQRGARHRHLADAPPARGRRFPRTRRRRSFWTGWCGANSTPPRRRASCWRSTPMAEAPPVTAAAAAGWIGADLAEINGDSVGQVQGFYVDAESGEPAG